MARKRDLSKISKWSAKQITSFKDLPSLNLEQTQTLAKRAYELTSKRIGRIEKSGVWSPAYEKYFGATKPSAPTETMRRQALQVKLMQYRQFLGAKTSTVQGITKWNQQTYRRLYPDDVDRTTGEKMTFAEFMKTWDIDSQRRYWAAYTEFMHQNPRYYDQSERVQQMISRMSFWKKRSFNASDLDKVLKEMENYDAQYEYQPNVRTGRGTSKQR